MSEMDEFGGMDLEDRGGRHDYDYGDQAHVPASAGLTPSQTVGPFFAYGLTPGPYGYDFPEIHNTKLAGKDVSGDRIVLSGQVFDGQGTPIHDAMIELVQADAHGAFVTEPRNDGFTGFGRCGTGADGPDGARSYRFETIRPGATAPDAAPGFTLIVTMRGLLNHMITRAYLPEGPLESDPILSQVPEARRHTLIAQPDGPGAYRFDIHMQGPDETVFFDL